MVVSLVPHRVRGMTWSAAPLDLATPSADGGWSDVSGMSVTVATSSPKVLLSFTLSVRGAYDASDSEYAATGSLQLRFVVDGVPLRAGSTHVAATVHSDARVTADTAVGHAVYDVGDDRPRTATVQWKSRGDVAWRSDPSIKEGGVSGRVLTATAHETLASVAPLSRAALSATGSDWSGVPDSFLGFSLDRASTVRVGYAMTMQSTARLRSNAGQTIRQEIPV